jgi:DNA modification methylase
MKLKNDFSYINKEIEIYKLGSEEYIPEKETLDLCFTSPPYFDTEKYSNEDTQSYIKYSSSNEWINGYLKKTIQNCHWGLKKDGYLIINISNTPEYDFLERETIRLAKETGFQHSNTYHLILSSISGKGIKKEPVFIFCKL